MSANVFMSRVDVYVGDGELDFAVYEVRVEQTRYEDQVLRLEGVTEARVLRDALSAWLRANGEEGGEG